MTSHAQPDGNASRRNATQRTHSTAQVHDELVLDIHHAVTLERFLFLFLFCVCAFFQKTTQQRVPTAVMVFNGRSMRNMRRTFTNSVTS